MTTPTEELEKHITEIVLAYNSEYGRYEPTVDRLQALLTQQTLEARIDEWRSQVLTEDFEKFFPVDKFHDFVSVPSWHINERLAQLKKGQK